MPHSFPGPSENWGQWEFILNYFFQIPTYMGPVKANQKMTFFGFEMDLFWVFQDQFGLEPNFLRAGFDNKFKTPGFTDEACTKPKNKINNC